uniref:(California timema) hypothetical protein n=1 Tax=Timema californicum TaxID=61474 RepID=A0A7R9PCC9_TIMCA|nr:unnamed protein product [Timema californicum]
MGTQERIIGDNYVLHTPVRTSGNDSYNNDPQQRISGPLPLRTQKSLTLPYQAVQNVCSHTNPVRETNTTVRGYANPVHDAVCNANIIVRDHIKPMWDANNTVCGYANPRHEANNIVGFYANPSREANNTMRGYSDPVHDTNTMTLTQPSTAPPTPSTAWTASQSMFSKPSVTLFPLYTVPMRTPLSIGSLGSHYRSHFTTPMRSPLFSHWTRPGSREGDLTRWFLSQRLVGEWLPNSVLYPTSNHDSRCRDFILPLTTTHVAGTLSNLPPQLTLPGLYPTSYRDSRCWDSIFSNRNSRCWDFILPLTATRKIQKVTGGLTRLASRTKVKKEETIRVRYSSLSHYEVADWTLNHVALVKELVEVRTKQHQMNQAHMQRYVFEEWLQTETELTRERGLWGPVTPCRLDKWMLDMTEGPSRMRKKMMKNELFYLHYPYRPELDYGDNGTLTLCKLHLLPKALSSPMHWMGDKPHDSNEPAYRYTTCVESPVKIHYCPGLLTYTREDVRDIICEDCRQYYHYHHYQCLGWKDEPKDLIGLFF